MKTSDVLRKAGDVLRKRGWCQGFFVGQGGAVCVFGAVNTAATMDPCDGSLSHAPLNAVKSIVGNWPLHWNDRKRRTAAEVMHAIDAAYVLAIQEEGEDPADYEVL